MPVISDLTSTIQFRSAKMTRSNGDNTMCDSQAEDRPAANDVFSETNPPGADGLTELLSRARGGNRQSIGELLQQYRNYMMLLAATKLHTRLQPRISASDVVQETMLKAHRHFAQFQGASERELLAWLRQIVLTSLAGFVERHVLAAKRDIRREVSIERFEGVWDDSTSQRKNILHADCQTPSAGAQLREDAAILAERLAELPWRYRQVLVLRNIQGLSFDEVAARLNRSLGSTRMLWLRAIERIRAVYWRAEEHGK